MEKVKPAEPTSIEELNQLLAPKVEPLKIKTHFIEVVPEKAPEKSDQNLDLSEEK